MRCHSLVLLIFVGIVAQGCVDNDSSAFYITGHVVPQEGTCLLQPGSTPYARGAFNVEIGASLGLPISYHLFANYRNQLIDRSASSPLRANPNDIFVQGAEVQINDALGNSLDFGSALHNPYSVLGVAFIPAAGEVGQFGEGTGELQIIPPAYATALAGSVGGSVVVEVQPYGTTVGDVDIDGDPYQWPIDLCGGLCLFNPVATIDDASSCCSPGQDSVCDLLATAAP